MKIFLLFLVLMNHAHAFSDGDYDENRRFNEVAWISSHNAYSNLSEGWIYYQQVYSLKKQLEFGVRSFELDIYPAVFKDEKKIRFCHESSFTEVCKLTQTILRPGHPDGPPLVRDALDIIKEFLDKNPKAIITLLLESYLKTEEDSAMLLQDFQDAGLVKYMADAEKAKLFNLNPTLWPTLKTMREHNFRLIIIDDNNNPVKHMGFLQEKDYLSLSTYNLKSDPNCNARSQRHLDQLNNAHFLLRVDHFFESSFEMPNFIHQLDFLNVLEKIGIQDYRKLNSSKALIQFLQDKCMNTFKRYPNFVHINHLQKGDQGGIHEVIRWLNHEPVEKFYRITPLFLKQEGSKVTWKPDFSIFPNSFAQETQANNTLIWDHQHEEILMKEHEVTNCNGNALKFCVKFYDKKYEFKFNATAIVFSHFATDYRVMNHMDQAAPPTSRELEELVRPFRVLDENLLSPELVTDLFSISTYPPYLPLQYQEFFWIF